MRRIRHHIALILMGSLLGSCILENGTVSSEESQTATLRVELSGGSVSDSSSPATASGSSSSVVRTLCDTSLTAVLADSTLAGSTTTARSTKVRLRSFSEDNVSDLHVMVYNNEGSLTGHAYSSGGSVSVTTRSGEDCSVYALVNTGNDSLDIPATGSLLRSLTTSPDLTEVEAIKVNDNLLMSGSLTTDITAGENTVDSFSVCRLSARNILNITCGEDILLSSYAIRNLPRRSWIVARPNTAEADVSDDAVGDDAVDAAVSSDWLDTDTFSGTGIQTGSGTLAGTTYALTFYQYENRRGGRVAVGGTTGEASDQTQKATYAPHRATYVELNVNAGGTSITYKLYLGANAANYNVKRNGSYTYNLFVGASGMSVSSVGIETWTNATTETETEL